MNAQVLALIGQIPNDAIGRGMGHLHEIRDQAGIISRLVDHTSKINGPAEAPAKTAKAIASMRQGRLAPPRSNAPSISGANAARSARFQRPWRHAHRASMTTPSAPRRSCSAKRNEF